MGDAGWIVIPNWDRFQRYKDRDPAWIKLYLELERRDDWSQLTLAQRGLLASIWMQYALRNGRVRSSALPSLILQKVPRKSLEALNQAGFIAFSRQIPTALRARARETYNKETKTPKPPSEKEARKRQKTTGWRQVRGSHGMTMVPDPFGTDPPPRDAARPR